MPASPPSLKFLLRLCRFVLRLRMRLLHAREGGGESGGIGGGSSRCGGGSLGPGERFSKAEETFPEVEAPSSRAEEIFAEVHRRMGVDENTEHPFAEVIAVPNDAPAIDRLVAWTGRRP